MCAPAFNIPLVFVFSLSRRQKASYYTSWKKPSSARQARRMRLWKNTPETPWRGLKTRFLTRTTDPGEEREAAGGNWRWERRRNGHKHESQCEPRIATWREQKIFLQIKRELTVTEGNFRWETSKIVSICRIQLFSQSILERWPDLHALGAKLNEYCTQFHPISKVLLHNHKIFTARKYDWISL